MAQQPFSRPMIYISRRSLPSEIFRRVFVGKFFEKTKNKFPKTVDKRIPSMHTHTRTRATGGYTCRFRKPCPIWKRRYATNVARDKPENVSGENRRRIDETGHTTVVVRDLRRRTLGKRRRRGSLSPTAAGVPVCRPTANDANTNVLLFVFRWWYLDTCFLQACLEEVAGNRSWSWNVVEDPSSSYQSPVPIL